MNFAAQAATLLDRSGASHMTTPERLSTQQLHRAIRVYRSPSKSLDFARRHRRANKTQRLLLCQGLSRQHRFGAASIPDSAALAARAGAVANDG